MGTRGRIIALALGIIVMGARTAMAQNITSHGDSTQMIIEEQGRRIEQVSLNMPEISVYGSGMTLEEVKNGTGYLSHDKLELVDVSLFSDSGEGICYYVLLDISGSIPKAYFRTIKEGIQALQDSLGEKDRLVLCTFGEEVVLVADGEQTSAEMASFLENLKNQDQKTLLFEGIDRVAAMSEQRGKGVCSRGVLMVISDGEDIAIGRKQAQEAQNTLKEKGIPVYAFCIRDTATTNINKFGEFARMSGGALVTFVPDEAGQMLSGLAERLQNDICIEYRALTNVVTNKEERFSLKFADDSVLTREVMNVHWIPDTEAPYLIAGEAIGSQQIRLVFSEPVIGLEGVANYQVSFEGGVIGVTGVAFDQKDSTVVSLSLEKPVQNGTYEVSCANITDRSMEKNPLNGSIGVVIDNVRDSKPVQAPSQAEPADYTGVLFLIFMAVFALIIIVLAKVRKKSVKENPTPMGSGDGTEPHNRILPEKEKIILQVGVSMNDMRPKQTKWEIQTSLIVGRSSLCDICFDDPEMSRQHFSLEVGGDELYITDLNSMNGTFVNGIRTRGKRRLEPGAVIEAGSMKIKVGW